MRMPNPRFIYVLRLYRIHLVSERSGEQNNSGLEQNDRALYDARLWAEALRWLGVADEFECHLKESRASFTAINERHTVYSQVTMESLSGRHNKESAYRLVMPRPETVRAIRSGVVELEPNAEGIQVRSKSGSYHVEGSKIDGKIRSLEINEIESTFLDLSQLKECCTHFGHAEFIYFNFEGGPLYARDSLETGSQKENLTILAGKLSGIINVGVNLNELTSVIRRIPAWSKTIEISLGNDKPLRVHAGKHGMQLLAYLAPRAKD